jgi:hypothetical protein
MEEVAVKVAAAPKPANPQSQTATKTQDQSALSNPITRKLNKILESRIENDKVFQPKPLFSNRT